MSDAGAARSALARPGGAGASIGRRFLTGAALVLAVAVVTIFVVDLLVGPAIFHSHLLQADLSDPTTVLHHVEQALRSSNLIALAVASLVGVTAALLVSLYLMRRVAASLAPLAAAAEQVAAGDYSARVPSPALGSEFEAVTSAFNDMSVRLQTVQESRARLFSDLAHEMRTPIAVLIAQLEGMEDGVVSAEESSAVLRAQADRLARLSADIGLLSRAQEHAFHYDFQTVDVAEVVRGCAAAMELRFTEKGVDLAVDMSANVVAHADLHVLADVPTRATCTAFADATRLAQVITNLLANALHASSAGGHVWVDVAERAGRIEVGVTDDGIGIAPDRLAEVFDRFARVGAAADSSPGGFGIGLTVAREIMAAHHGGISATSEGLGRGARFVVWLPAAANDV